MSEFVTCTPHRATTRFHVVYDDFIIICKDDFTSGNALRVGEVKTNRRIASLRDRYAIPDTYLPHEDDLWFEVSCRDLSWLSLNVRGKSAYARVIADHHDEKHPTLIQRGFWRSRFIARPDEAVRPIKPLRRVYHDDQGPFIIVDDPSGGYEVGGKTYSAVDQGYMRIVKQFLYCIEAVNAALAALGNDPPPTSLQRWVSISAEREAKRKSGGRTTAHSLTTNDDADPTEEGGTQEDRRGSSLTSAGTHSTYHDNTIKGGVSRGNGRAFMANSGQSAKNCAVHHGTGLSDTGQGRPSKDGSVQARTAVSEFQAQKKEEKNKEFLNTSKKGSAHCASFPLLSSKIDVAELRNAAWTPDTILALSSRVLDVPDFAEILASGDIAAIEWYYEEWLRPAERLLAATITVAPSRAWEEIDLSQRYMTEPGSPSWWRHRDKDTPITMAHVERNHKIQLKDARKKAWWPTETTPYDGPTDTWLSPQSPTERHTDDLPPLPSASPQLRSMSKRVADSLALRMLDELPMLIVGTREASPCRFLVGIEIAPDVWHDFDVVTWEDPSEELREIIVQAVVYGEDCAGSAAAMA